MPADADIIAHWQQCQADWLNQIARKSGQDNTRRAYESDMHDFYSYCERQPWEITAIHAEAWVQDLARRALAAGTINRKLSALSSLYRYANEYPHVGPVANPFMARSLRKKTSAQPVQFPTLEQIDDLLQAIPTRTTAGLRNLAIIAGLVATTRRISEWLDLKSGDIEHVGRLHWFTYRCKGGEPKRQEMPDANWRIIETYLRRADRWPLPSEDYIFVALSANGERLNHCDGDQGPLNPGYVARLIMRYGKDAGIPEACLYPHALRHAGAELRRELGADILALQPILGHKSPATTASYLRRLDRPRDPQAETIGERLLKRINIDPTLRVGGEAR